MNSSTLLSATFHIICLWYFAFSSIFHQHNHQLCRERIHFYRTSFSFNVHRIWAKHTLWSMRALATRCILKKDALTHENRLEWNTTQKTLIQCLQCKQSTLFQWSVFGIFIQCHISNLCDYLTVLKGINMLDIYHRIQNKGSLWIKNTNIIRKKKKMSTSSQPTAAFDNNALAYFERNMSK